MTESLLARLGRRAGRVAVLGQGYVGLPLALHASEAGFEVVGLDIDDDKVASLRAGRSPIDDVPDEILVAALARGFLPTAAPADIAGFDVAVISVPTPLRDGLPDVTSIEAAADTVGTALRPGCLVVLESTTYPGTTEELLGPRLEERSGGLRPGVNFFLGYSPERIDPGQPERGLRQTPKIVSGVNADSLAAVEAFFGAFVEKLVPVATTAEAELAKLIENTFRHVNVALVNELAMFAGDLGIDIWAAIDAASTKPFGFLPFRPGPGVGGHCLPVDPSYLSWRVQRRLGETFRFVELANDVNRGMPRYVVRRVQAMLNRDGMAVNGATVLVLGLAYKPGTSDARESPSLAVIEQLLALGARVRACDSGVGALALDAAVERVEFSAEALRAADLVLLLTDHPDFDYELIATESRRVFDTRDRLRGYGGPNVERL